MLSKHTHRFTVASVAFIGVHCWAAGAASDAPEVAVRAVAAGHSHDILLLNDGSAWSLGANNHGQLGDGTNRDRKEPTRVVLDGVRRVAAGYHHSVFLLYNGSVFASGWNQYGQIGDGSHLARNAPVRLPIEDVVGVAAGLYHTVFLQRDGSVLTTGHNWAGQLADGGVQPRSSPARVETPEAVVLAVFAGAWHTGLLRSDQGVDVAGWNREGQLADKGMPGFLRTPTHLQVEGVTFADAGEQHTIMLDVNGDAWGLGDNTFGQLGDGSKTDQLRPARLALPDKLQSVAAGGLHTLFLTRGGKVYASGLNDDGQVGDGTYSPPQLPVLVVDGGVRAVSAGYAHSLLVTGEGAVYAWGRRYAGPDMVVSQDRPVRVACCGVARLAAGAPGLKLPPAPQKERQPGAIDRWYRAPANASEWIPPEPTARRKTQTSQPAQEDESSGTEGALVLVGVIVGFLGCVCLAALAVFALVRRMGRRKFLALFAPLSPTRARARPRSKSGADEGVDEGSQVVGASSYSFRHRAKVSLEEVKHFRHEDFNAAEHEAAFGAPRMCGSSGGSGAQLQPATLPPMPGTVGRSGPPKRGPNRWPFSMAHTPEVRKSPVITIGGGMVAVDEGMFSPTLPRPPDLEPPDLEPPLDIEEEVIDLGSEVTSPSLVGSGASVRSPPVLPFGRSWPCGAGDRLQPLAQCEQSGRHPIAQEAAAAGWFPDKVSVYDPEPDTPPAMRPSALPPLPPEAAGGSRPASRQESRASSRPSSRLGNRQ